MKSSEQVSRAVQVCAEGALDCGSANYRFECIGCGEDQEAVAGATAVQSASRILIGWVLACLVGGGLFVAQAVSAVPRDAAAADRESDLYKQGTQALDANQWDKAVDAFDRVIQIKGSQADGALYWKAYALNKLGRREDALSALAAVERSFPKSRWIDDAKALEVEIRQSLGQAVSPEEVQVHGSSGSASADSTSNDDLKLMAINGLMNSDPERAIPLLEKVLQGNQSTQVKERALFVLSQSSSPKARAVMAGIARGSSNRPLQEKALKDLGLFGGEENKAELAKIYASSDDTDVKRWILQGFMVAGEKDRLLSAAKSEKNSELRSEAVKQLGVMGAGNELGQLYQNEPSVDVRKQIIKAMFVGGQVERLSELAKTEKQPALRLEAIRSLGLMGPRTADTLTSLYQKETDVGVRKELLNAFFLQGNAKALVNIARNEKDPELRKTCVEKLSIMNSKDSTDFMLELLNK